jgi:prolyl 4-hydroxylase
MQRIMIAKPSEVPNFIGSWAPDRLELYDDLITYFELNNEKQQKGLTGGGLDRNIKSSTDIQVYPYEIKLPENDVLRKYIETLFFCYKDYLLQWPFLGEIAEKLEIGSFNIQRYQVGEHFQKIHTERSSIATLHRILAWMTYLNDVEEGGTTYFEHYGLEIKPRKGLTLIWPAEWTHAHKGNILNSGSKYIVTGWLNLCN